MTLSVSLRRWAGSSMKSIMFYPYTENCKIGTGSLVKELETIIGEPVYEFGDYYISILHSDWKTELYALFGRNFPELTAFIKKTNMYASLSYGFFDITDAAQAMRQTVRVIEIIRKYKWSQRINGYGDMEYRILSILPLCTAK